MPVRQHGGPAWADGHFTVILYIYTRNSAPTRVYPMSTPNEFPGPEHPGSLPSPPGYGSQPDPSAPQAAASGSEVPDAQNPGYPPAGQQPPPGYQQPAYQQPGYQQPVSDFKFEMPKDMPHSVKDVMPAGGFAGIFKMDGMPQLLKISYIIWLVTAGIWFLLNIVLLLGSLIALGAQDSLFGYGAAVRAAGVKGIIVSIIAFVLIAAIVICAMKLKEGVQWARLALSAIVVLGFIMLFFGASGSGLLGVVAAVLMWLPESTAWFNSRAKGVS